MSNKIYIRYFKTAYGELMLGSYEDKLCLCDWRFRKMRASIDRRVCEGLQADYVEGDSDVIQKTPEQLLAYFEKTRTCFDIPLLTVGTEFQKKVWDELLQIPYGSTMSYLTLSRKLGDEKAIRAVASANGANAISILIPCHRIIGSKGELTGYAGGLQSKKRLLELEGGLGDGQLKIQY
jgi:methylated-DNA-[protein]-cysteine S-methyltransferase